MLYSRDSCVYLLLLHVLVHYCLHDLLGSLYEWQKLSVGYKVHLFVCFRHTPSMYPISTAGAGFRSPYPSSLPITSTSLSR